MTSYEKAGVSVDTGNIVEEKIGELVKSTYNKSVLLSVGSFSGAVSAKELKKYKEPVLMVTIDGAGTKTKIAASMNKWDYIGMDVVNHCSNDLLCSSAKPLFFVDYLASSKLDVSVITKIISGMSKACKGLDCPLVGGETAEMPGVYLDGENDVVGCMVGVAEKRHIFNPKNVKKGDMLVGLPSSGLHTNGYSLARKVLLEKYSLGETVEGFYSALGEELLRPHKSYSKNVFSLMNKVKIKGIAHITGGGLLENVPRVLPEKLSFEIDNESWQVPQIFKLIQKTGSISDYEMFRAFNMGVGLVLVVSKSDAKKTISNLSKLGEKAFVLGKVI